jgi:hypothetical protein
VKTRLIVHEDADWVLPSSGDIGPSPEPSKEHPCLWPVEQEVPDGWEEIVLDRCSQMLHPLRKKIGGEAA